jgi:heme A synthase
MFLSMQVTLGAFVVWSRMDPVINTAHVVNGALVLGTSLVLTLRAHRPRFRKQFADSRLTDATPALRMREAEG